METVGDPDLQSYFEKTRAESGINVVPLAGAAAPLRSALAKGDAVALVADRAIGGGGAVVELFGSPARLPTGPAALALESGAPAWLVATRRAGRSEYRVRLERIEGAPNGTRREQLASFMTAEAAAFERAIADAPEQWWTLFFPIWDDRGQG
jgi:KDO2-lipid IV(A) lauroyltransferase